MRAVLEDSAPRVVYFQILATVSAIIWNYKLLCKCNDRVLGRRIKNLRNV